jgi:hypothetical protein
MQIGLATRHVCIGEAGARVERFVNFHATAPCEIGDVEDFSAIGIVTGSCGIP